jgi:hypothetical protein
MRCARCQFENIPGQTRCIRCGSILETDGAVLQIYPPRMPAWRKPFRATLRGLRRCWPAREPAALAEIRRGLEPILSDSVVGLVLSVVPGLAHLRARRFREVALLVVLWLIVLGAGLYLYGSRTGSLLIGLAIGIHAWIAVQYGLFKEGQGFFERAGAVLVVVALLGALYWATPRVVARGLTGGHTALTIPALNVHPGDYFLARRPAHPDEELTRGTLVLIEPGAYRHAGHQRALAVNGRQRMVGQIVGLPGETIRVQSRAYEVGEEWLDPNRFPVPRWLQAHPPRSRIVIPAGSYFVSSEYTIQAHGNVGILDQYITDLCVLRAEEVRGRVFMQWWPLNRRRFLE